MNIWFTYFIIAAILVVAELCYFKVADHFKYGSWLRVLKTRKLE